MIPSNSNRLAILGAGHVGQAIGGSLAARGYALSYGVPEPAKYRHLESPAGPGAIRVLPVEEALAGVEIVILATPYSAALQIGRSVPDWQGRILVDATNPIAPGLAGLLVGTDSSGAEEIARLAPTAHVVKAFNTTGFENLADPRYPAGGLFLPVAGDDAAARQRVLALALSMGFDAVDLGPLKAARYLEPLAMVWIEMALKGGHGRRFGFVRAQAGPAA
jgi:predicted dinucleotide-binding enzyme